MPTFDPYIGRREAIGLAAEATPGTPVAPALWVRWLDQDIQNKTEVVENESAMGVVEKVNDSEVVGKWVEGTLGGKITEQGIGYFLLGIFGSVSTGAAVGGIYPHTFTVNQSSIPKTLTIAKSGPAGSFRYPYATIDTFELTAEKQGFVQVSSAVKARIGVTSTETVAFLAEKEFTSKNIVLKTATTTAGLTAAPAIEAISLKLNLERPSENFFALGDDVAPKFDNGVFEAKGEFVVRYTDTAYEDDFLANAIKALSITVTNGTTSLSFTAGRARFRELNKSISRDDITTLAISFYCELDTTTSQAINAVLKNPKTLYA